MSGFLKNGVRVIEYLHPKTALLFWIAVVLGAGTTIGFIFGPDTWYQTLLKPSWSPPGWFFVLAWTMLYIMVGISVWLVRRTLDVDEKVMRRAMKWFWLQLGLNLLWTLIFFGLHNPLLAFIDIFLLWVAAVAMTTEFGKIRYASGYLLLPYGLWIAFVLILNGTIWLLNQ